MKTKAQIFMMAAATVVAVLGLSGHLGAQPENQPYVFMGDSEGHAGSYLGVDTNDITPERMKDLHLREESGVEVTMVDQDAPAGKAGLKEHDVILNINDEKIESEEQLRRVIHEIPAGRTVTIGISRDGQPMTLKAQLAERSMDRDFNFSMPNINVPAIRIPPINMPEIDVPSIVVIHSPRSSGMMVENLTPQLGEFFGVKTGNGVLVRSVEKGSRAEQAGLRAGDVIVKVNGSGVSDCSDFTRLLHDRKQNKASIVVIRDHKEQDLTLTLPESRHSGSLENCDYAETATCARAIDGNHEDAAIMPEFNTAELKRLKPEMEQLRKQIKQAIEEESGDVEKDIQEMKQELHREQQEIQREVNEWKKNSEI